MKKRRERRTSFQALFAPSRVRGAAALFDRDMYPDVVKRRKERVAEASKHAHERAMREKKAHKRKTKRSSR